MQASQQPISDRVRSQLLAMGIPAAKHDAQALARFFPRELNIAATELSAEDIASVLIYLVEKQFMPAPVAGGFSAVRTVRPGWHLCQFYRGYGEMLNMIAPYMAEGLRGNEGCLWVMPQAVSKQAACRALAQQIERVEEYVACGQLEMLSHPNWYLDDLGRLKSFEQISGALLAKQDRALAKGYKFLRAAGDAGWVSGTEQSKKFIEYEMKVNAALGATKVACMCTYRADVTADELVAIVKAHQDALYRSAA